MYGPCIFNFNQFPQMSVFPNIFRCICQSHAPNISVTLEAFSFFFVVVSNQIES